MDRVVVMVACWHVCGPRAIDPPWTRGPFRLTFIMFLFAMWSSSQPLAYLEFFTTNSSIGRDTTPTSGWPAIVARGWCCRGHGGCTVHQRVGLAKKNAGPMPLALYLGYAGSQCNPQNTERCMTTFIERIDGCVRQDATDARTGRRSRKQAARARARPAPPGMARQLRWLLAALLAVTAPYGEAQDEYHGHGQANVIKPVDSCDAYYGSELVHDLVIPRTRPLGLRLTELDPGKPGVHAVAVEGVASEAALEAFGKLPSNHMVMQVRNLQSLFPSVPLPAPPPICALAPNPTDGGTPYFPWLGGLVITGISL